MLLHHAPRTLRPCLRCLTSSAVIPAGHNKWSKIKEGKGANDKAKSKIYGKANRDILNAVKSDSANPILNSALAAAVAKAKEAGVPKANIQAALQQASKTAENDNTQEFEYEAMFAGKVGLVIGCRSDNGTRTIRELKEIIKDHGAQLTTVSYMFEKKAVISVSISSSASYEDLLLDSLNCGALDVSDKPDRFDQKEVIKVETSPDNCDKLFKALQNLDYTVIDSQIPYLPIDGGVVLEDETREAALAFVEEINDHPDVHWVHVSPSL